MSRKNPPVTQSGLYRSKKLPEYKTFRLSRHIKSKNIKQLPTVRQLWRETWLFVWQHRVKLLIFSGVYLLIYLVLVKGYNGFSVDAVSMKESIAKVSDGTLRFVLSLLGVYSALVGTLLTTENASADLLQAMILVVCSLAFIWLLRKLHAKDNAATVKQAFYLGPQPLVPFLLVLLIMLLETMPAGFGGLLLTTAQGAGAISTQLEIQILGIVAILCMVLSFYLLAGSVFALYIVTLPGTEPVVAVRTSMHLLRVHRWQIVYRLAAFVGALMVLGLLLSAPFIIWLPKYAEHAFFVIGMSSFVVFHTFVYKLYRAML